MSDINLKNKIMRRVYAIWFFRKITSAVFVETFIFAAMLLAAVSCISFLSVMRNALNSSNSVYSLSNFFLNNFLIADAISKSLVLGMMIMTLILGWELFKKKNPQIVQFP